MLLKGGFMGLFDSLIKNVIKEVAPDVNVDEFVKSAGDIVKGLANEAESFAEKLPENLKAEAASAAETAGDYAESGDSWGPEMPDEPNQFNYSGTYLEYFTEIFQTEFPEYRVARAVGTSRKPVTVFTFWNGDAKALVVELMPQSSAAKKLRRDCADLGIPYLRYYYDHDGWWNTRSYVIRRTRAALKG